MMVCTGRRGNLEDERRFGRLGWRMLEEFQAIEWQPRVTAALVYNVSHSLRAQIKPLQAAHCSGLIHGDVHVSSDHEVLYCVSCMHLRDGACYYLVCGT